MGSSSGRYDVYLTSAFETRMRSLAVAGDTDRHAERLQNEAARAVRRLENGKENGHHPLTDRTGDGRGDLRDCTVSEFRSDPNGKLDCRLVWRQLPEHRPGAGPVRELVHVGRRHESPDTYQQSLQILQRQPTEQVAENEPFGSPAYTGDQNGATRTAALDAQRTVALARQGVAPMATSRPLAEFDFGARGGAGNQQRQTAQTLSKNPEGPQP